MKIKSGILGPVALAALLACMAMPSAHARTVKQKKLAAKAQLVVANRMRETDVAAVAAWLASREPPADMHPIPASAQTEPLPGWCVMGESGVEQ